MAGTKVNQRPTEANDEGVTPMIELVGLGFLLANLLILAINLKLYTEIQKLRVLRKEE